MKYIKLFETHSGYESYIEDDPELPNVSYCEDNYSIHYNRDYIIVKYELTTGTTVIPPGSNYSGYEILKWVINGDEIDTNDYYNLPEDYQNIEAIIEYYIPKETKYISIYSASEDLIITIPEGIEEFTMSVPPKKIILPSTFKRSTYFFSVYNRPCSYFTNITVKATEPPIIGEHQILYGGYYGGYNNYSNLNIYVPETSINAYKTATGWSNYANNIFADQETISDETE